MFLFSTKFWYNWWYDPREAIEPFRNRGWNIQYRIASFFVFWRIVFSEYMLNHCLTRASAMGFALLLTLIPLMATASFILASLIEVQPFEVQQTLSFFLPYAPSTVMEHIGVFLGNARKLRGIGVIVLIIMSVGLFGMVEESLNAVFKVARSRSFFVRLRTFTMVMVYSPVLFFGSFHFRQSLNVNLEIGPYYASLYDIVSFLLAVLAFTTLNWYVPNVKVRFRSAFLGGLVAGLLFEAEREGFGSYVRFSSQTQSIYGAFGIQVLFLVSLLVVSAFVLFGAQIAYAHQNFRPLLRAKKRGERRLGDFQLYLSFRILVDIVEAFMGKKAPATLGAFLQKYELNESQAGGIMEKLVGMGMVHAVDGKGAYVPSQDFGPVMVRDVVDAMEHQNRKISVAPDDYARECVRGIFESMRQYTSRPLEGLTFAQLVHDIQQGDVRQKRAATIVT